MDLLRQFTGDYHTKNAVLAYLQDYLEQEIIIRARKGEDVRSLAEAINEIYKAFDNLDIQYGIKQKQNEQVNEAS